MDLYLYKVVAAVNYSESTYGAGNYQEVAGTSTGTETGGPLANTGYDVIVPASLGLAIVAASAILLVKKALRARRQQS